MPAANSGVVAPDVMVALSSAVPTHPPTKVNVVGVVPPYVQVTPRPSTLNVPPPALKPAVELTRSVPTVRSCAPTTAVVAFDAFRSWK